MTIIRKAIEVAHEKVASIEIESKAGSSAGKIASIGRMRRLSLCHATDFFR